jgi:hypothetical protein
VITTAYSSQCAKKSAPEDHDRSEDGGKRLFHQTILKRAVIGFTSGVISSVALVTTLRSPFLGIAFGVVIGALYGLAVRPPRFAYAESIFTAGSLGIPLWAVVSIIVLPALAGNGPQWVPNGMRALFPRGVGAVWSQSWTGRQCRCCPARLAPVMLSLQPCHALLLEAAFPLRHGSCTRPQSAFDLPIAHPIGQRENQSRSGNLTRRQCSSLRPAVQFFSLFGIHPKQSLIISHNIKTPLPALCITGTSH